MVTKTKPSHQEIAQSTRLKACISTRGISEDDAIEMATKKIAHMEASYKDWLKEQFAILKKSFYKDGFGNPEDIKLLFHQAHDIKSLGSTFGYFLITDVADCLCSLLEYAIEKNTHPQQALLVHMQALELVVIKNVKGDENMGPAEQKLLSGLNSVFEKVKAKA